MRKCNNHGKCNEIFVRKKRFLGKCYKNIIDFQMPHYEQERITYTSICRIWQKMQT